VEAFDERVSASLSASAAGQGVELAFYGGPLELEHWDAVLARAGGWLAEGAVQGIRVAARPDRVTRDGARVLAASGVHIVELDVPSMSEIVLDQLGPAHARAHVERAAAALRDAGIKVGIQVRPGLPASHLEHELYTIERVIGLEPAFVRIYPVLVLRGTWLERAFHLGRYVPMTVDEAVRTCRLLVDRLADASIPVVRVGLQPVRDLELEPGCVVAGPYHPSLRTLIEAERMYERAAALLAAPLLPGRHVLLYVSPVSESNLRGPENCNLARLRKQFHCASVGVCLDSSLPREALRIEYSTIKQQARQRFAS
jgi:hypothetical protein